MNEQISEFIRKPWVLPTGIGVASFAGGVGLGYFLGCKRWQKVAVEAVDAFEDLVEDKIDDLFDKVLGPDDFIIEQKQPGIVIPEEALPRPDPSRITVDEEVQVRIDELLESGATLDEMYETITTDKEDEEVTIVNVFAGSDDEWDYEVEKESRSETEPFVIHKDEYFSNEEDYHQQTLTWYQGDDILVDDGLVPIYDRGLIGELKFGHGSGDANVFYVRNDKNKAEYEVLRDTGHYAIEVLGLDAEPHEEIKHSHRRFILDE